MSDLHDITDSDILALSAKHPSAFGVLIDRYHKEFLRKVTSILKNEEEAEDVVQDAFIKIYNNANRYKIQPGASFKSWAYKILLNTCYTACKKKNREKLFRDQAQSEDLDLLKSDNEFESIFDRDHILSVISKIPEALAQLLRSSLIQGKTYEDIAREEGISSAAVRTRMHRAKTAFKKALQLYAK